MTMKTLTKTQLAAGGVDIESLALSLAYKALYAAAEDFGLYNKAKIAARLLRALGDRFDLDVEVATR